MGRLNAPYPIFYIQYPKNSSNLILIPAPNIDVSPPYLGMMGSRLTTPLSNIPYPIFYYAPISPLIH